MGISHHKVPRTKIVPISNGRRLFSTPLIKMKVGDDGKPCCGVFLVFVF